MPIKSWGDLLNDAGNADGGFEPIPAGPYDFVISEAEATQSSTQKTMYKIRAKVENGAFAGKLVFHNFTVSPESPPALAMFFKQMNVLGLGREFFAQNPADSTVASSLVGKRFRGDVVIKQWNGSDRNEIKQISTPVAAVGQVAGAVPGVPAAAPAPAAPAPQAAAPAPPAPAAPVYQAPPAPAAPAPAPAPAAPVAGEVPPPPPFD